MKDISEAQLYLENRINRLRAIHRVVSKLDLFVAFQKSDPQIQVQILDVIQQFADSYRDLKYLRLKLAIICEDAVSLNILRDIAKDCGVSAAYKLTKTELISKLKGLK